MTAREKAVEVLETAAAGERRGPHFGEAIVSVLRDAGLVVVHAADVADRASVLDRADEALRAAVRSQLEDRDPAHEDFYAWGWLLTSLVEQLGDAAGVLRGQVEHYGDHRALRDDDGEVPARRLANAGGQLAVLQATAGQLRAAAARFHSEIGHVAVEQPPDPDGGEPT